MTSRQGQLILAVLVCLLFVLAGSAAAATKYDVEISYDSHTHICQQKLLPAGSSGPAVGPFYPGDTITYTARVDLTPGAQFVIRFPIRTPIKNFRVSAVTNVTTGPTIGTGFYGYSVLSVGNQTCKSPSPLGIIMR